MLIARYGDVVTNEMSEAHARVVQMALAKATDFVVISGARKLLKIGGSEWGSNPSVTGEPATRRF